MDAFRAVFCPWLLSWPDKATWAPQPSVTGSHDQSLVCQDEVARAAKLRLSQFFAFKICPPLNRCGLQWALSIKQKMLLGKVSSHHAIFRIYVVVVGKVNIWANTNLLDGSHLCCSYYTNYYLLYTAAGRGGLFSSCNILGSTHFCLKWSCKNELWAQEEEVIL